MRESVIKVRHRGQHKSNLYIALAMILVFPSFATVVQYTIGGNLFRFAPMLAGTAILVLSFRRKGLQIDICFGNEVVLWLAFLAMALFRNKDIVNGMNIGAIGTFFIIIMLIPFLKARTDWIALFYRIFLIFMSVHIAVTLICYIFPAFYDQVISPAIGFQRYYSLGYMRGLCENHGSNAFYIASGVMLLVAKALNEQKKLYVMCIVLSVFALLLTVKRGVLLFGAIASVLTYLITMRQTNGKLKNILFLVIGITVVYFVLEVCFPDSLRVFDRFAPDAQDDISSGRFYMYEAAFSYFLDSPLLGIGWGGFKYRYIALNNIDASSGYNTHDIYLQMLCETGIVGIAIFVWIAWYSLRTAIQMLSDWDQYSACAEYARWHLTASAIYQMYFLLYGLTGNPMYDMELFVPYLFSCAAVYAIRNQNNQTEKKRFTSKYIRAFQTGCF